MMEGNCLWHQTVMAQNISFTEKHFYVYMYFMYENTILVDFVLHC